MIFRLLLALVVYYARCGTSVPLDDSLDFRHHDHDSMNKYLQEIHSRCPNITRLYSLGVSVENRNLTVIEISRNPGKEEKLKPNFKYVANMHGNEV